MSMASGIIFDHFDAKIRAQDDLFMHVNGRWVRDHVIPEDRARDGAFHDLRDQSEIDVRAIIEGLAAAAGHTPGSSEQQIADLYRSFMDTAAIEAAGLTPLQPLLAEIDSIDSLDSAALTLGRLQRQQLAALFSVFVYEDKGDTTRYLTYAYQGGLGLPDEAYYHEAAHADTLASYRQSVAALLEAAGAAQGADAAAQADLIVNFETALASHHWTAVESREAAKTYNLTTWQDAQSRATTFSVDRWMQGFAPPFDLTGEVCLGMPSFFDGLGEVWTAANLDAIKAWLRFHVVHSLAPFLNDALVEANFDFFGRTLTGAPEIRERWKRGVELCEGSLGDALGQIYVAKHFPESHKAKMDVLVANLIEAYRVSIQEQTWMTEETREKALEKLGKFTPYVGYPRQWRDYSLLVIDPSDLVGNVVRAGEDATRRNLDLLGKPIQKELWHMTPQTVNAYYSPTANSIVFPAAILQPPFFNAEADDAVNYGGIGAVIGHEIGHGFDDQGSRYDGEGNLQDWWTAADREAFEQRTGALIAQYDAFVPRVLSDAAEPGDDLPHVNGALTIGENIGDLGGLGIALKAYDLALGGAQAPVLEGYTGRQRVFLGWAQVWRTTWRPEEAMRLLSIDPHSPAEFRCNGIVTNLDAFYEEFEVREGDALYTAPEQRVRIW
ncbi:peptidase M13 [Micrococcales bacterium 31B]|nr:peptidase M13 [Micrococcales bacterium 31B]